MRKSRSPNFSVYGNQRVGNRRTFPWPFEPIQERSLSLWLRAGDEMYTDDSTTLVSSDGQAVQMWRNIKNTAERYRQATAGNKPTYKTNIVNGHPVLRFDGGDFLARNNSDHFFGGAANTMIMVVSDSSTTGYIWNGNGTEGGPSFITGSLSREFEYFTHSSGERQTFATTASGFHILTVVRPEGAGEHRLHYDGQLVATGTNVNNGNGNWAGLLLDRIGWRSGGASGITGDIAEMMHFTRVLPVERLNDFHRYLGLYYAIPVVLP